MEPAATRTRTRARTRGQRAGLTQERVLTAAGELLTEQGLAALTMRAVARRLAVAPNAIYSHVADKTALIDGVLDAVLADVEAPEPAHVRSPRAGLVAVMSSAYEVLLDNPELVPLYVARQGARGANAQRLGQVVLALLDRAGVSGPSAREALRVLIVYTIGFAGFSSRRPFEEGDGDQALDPQEVRRNFDAGLRWLLNGITHTGVGR